MQLPNTIQIKNGEKVKPTFSAQEYANRQGKLRACLAQNNIDGCRCVGQQDGQNRLGLADQLK